MLQNDPKKSFRLSRQNGEIFMEYFSGEDRLWISPRILEMFNSQIMAQYIDFDQTVSVDHVDGRMHHSSTEETVAIDMVGGKVELNVGMETLIPRRVRNDSGVDIKNGDLVYITGGTGNNVAVALAKADAEATAEYTLAMATEDIDDNSRGFATIFGIVRGDTDQPIDTSSWDEGTILYLSADTAGGFTATMPTHPNYVVPIGQVFRQHATDGSILVSIKHPITAKEIAGGESFVWLDENFNSVGTATGAAAPDLINYAGTSILVPALDGGGTQEELNGWREYQHNAVESVDSTSTQPITVHAHLGPVNTNVGDIVIKCEYHVEDAMTGEVKASGTLTKVTSEVADGTAWRTRVTSIGTIDITNAEIGDQIGLRLYRTPTDTSDTYGSDIYVKTWGYHYKADSIGSRNIQSKG